MSHGSSEGRHHWHASATDMRNVYETEISMRRASKTPKTSETCFTIQNFTVLQTTISWFTPAASIIINDN